MKWVVLCVAAASACGGKILAVDEPDPGAEVHAGVVPVEQGAPPGRPMVQAGAPAATLADFLMQQPWATALDESSIYVGGSGGEVLRVDRATGVDSVVDRDDGAGHIPAIASDAEHVYWAARWKGIKRALKRGGAQGGGREGDARRSPHAHVDR